MHDSAKLLDGFGIHLNSPIGTGIGGDPSTGALDDVIQHSAAGARDLMSGFGGLGHGKDVYQALAGNV